jgi:hypothetical protein
MLRKGLLIIACLGPVFASPSARADICFQYGTGGGVSAAIGTKLPALPNQCIRVTLVEQSSSPGSRWGIATGSICTGDLGSGFATLVVQYTYDACAGPGGYFESATCRINIQDSSAGGVFGLPSQPTSQPSSCNGVYADPMSHQSGPLTQFTDTTLKVWNCSNNSVPGGGGPTTCVGGNVWRPFSHPKADGATAPK